MRNMAGALLVALAAALGGCQSTGGQVDPELARYCTSYGYGRPGDANYEQCLIDHSFGRRGLELDKRTVGANGT